MTLESQILIAVGLDLVLGDPRWLPHPVKGIGRLAASLEWVARRLIPWTTVAGIVTALAVCVTVGVTAWGAIRVAGMAHPIAADVVSIVLIYTAVAARDLTRHSMAVFRPLVAGDLGEARNQVGKMVGRDTDGLDEVDVTRATVESVAENTVDGVTGPLFWSIIAGPVGAMVYRAVSTLDSTFGYKNEQYAEFGWASARIEDVVTFIPARLTAPVVALAAIPLRQRPILSLRILRRDGRNHASPNAGLAEAAVAGALGVQLGGLNFYGGQPVATPKIGEPKVPLSARHILLANALMFVTTGCFLAAGLIARVAAVHLWCLWRTV